MADEVRVQIGDSLRQLNEVEAGARLVEPVRGAHDVEELAFAQEKRAGMDMRSNQSECACMEKRKKIEARRSSYPLPACL